MTIKYRTVKYPEVPFGMNPEEDDYDESYENDFDLYSEAEAYLIKEIEKLEAKPSRFRQEFQIKKIYIANPDAQ